MELIGQTVPDRYTGILRQIIHDGLVKTTVLNTIINTSKYTCCIRNAFLLVFGNVIYRKVIQLLPVLHDFAAFVISIRMLIIFCLLTMFFIFVYRVLPNKKTPLLYVLPGAISCSIGWMITSSIFAIYFNTSHSFAYMYGSLAGIMMIMLWLYTCMYQLFLGAELNNLLHPELISGDTAEDIFN